MAFRGTSILLVLVLATGCTRDLTEADARGHYQQRKGTLDRVERELKAALKKYPYAGPRHHCPAAMADAAGNANLQCLTFYRSWLRNSLVAERAFAASVGKRWLDLDGVKAAVVSISRAEPLRPRVLNEAALVKKQPPTRWTYGCGSSWPANRKGAVPLANGFKVDGRQVGYGLGQLTFDAGEGKRYKDGGKYYPQLDVAWGFEHKQLKVKVEVNVLGRDQTPLTWRAARKAYCQPTR